MTTYTKQYYSIGEVSQLLEVPIYTLRFWEDSFPMFNPNRSPKGTRRYTQADVKLAATIKELLYDKGLKIDAAVIFLNKNYRKQPPRQLRKCKTAADALALLDEVKETLDDAHSIARLEAVEKWLNSIELSSQSCAANLPKSQPQQP